MVLFDDQNCLLLRALERLRQINSCLRNAYSGVCQVSQAQIETKQESGYWQRESSSRPVLPVCSAGNRRFAGQRVN